ncbi:MAG: urate hydroxylase PuuD [Planctomycetes bacterium]|nr:urate hydroxylase PuuD [Planctomycetota bacterium]
MEALQDYGMLLRWIHFVAGVTWIGLLWFYNYMNGPFSNALEPEVRAKVIPQIMPRTLWWFRWGAAVTWLSGVTYAYGVIARQDPEGTMHWMTETTRGQWITMGFVYGSIMAFNVWFMIWPRQQKIIRATIAGENPPEKAQWAKTATNCSRVNTYLSLPLLFAMGAGKHMGEFSLNSDMGSFWVNAVVITLIGFAVAWLFIHKVGPSVGKNFK